MILAIEGLDVAAKADLAERAIWSRIDGGQASFEIADVDLAGSDPALLRITVLDKDKAKVGRAFSAAVIETGLASYPGFYGLSPPGDASMYGVYWPCAVPADLISTSVLIGSQTAWTGPARVRPAGSAVAVAPARTEPMRRLASTPTRRLPVGTIAGARSGDKGGNANLGVWVRTAEEFDWLDSSLTAERLASLVPSVAGLPIERYRLPNLLALNFVIIGLLGRGVAASTRLDPQAKALGEELRAAIADVPQALLPPE